MVVSLIKDWIQELKTQLTKMFEMKDLGAADDIHSK